MKFESLDVTSKRYENAMSYVGRRFGHLVVTGIAGKKNGATYVYCACDCGTTKHAVRLTSLTYNNTSSCGCVALGASANASRQKAQKYVGQTFGHLTITEILSREETTGRGAGVFCRVDCDCGTKGHITSLSRIINGYTKSCGHCGATRRANRPPRVPLLAQAQESVGKRFGRLVVTGVAGKRSPEGSTHEYLYVTCDCDCGTKGQLVPFRSIKFNKTKSCGCAHSSHNVFLAKNRHTEPVSAIRAAAKKAAAPKPKPVPKPIPRLEPIPKPKPAPKPKRDLQQEAVERAQQLVGKTCGRLTVKSVAGYLDRPGKAKKRLYVWCDCECGKKDHLVLASTVRQGHVQSCGCLRAEIFAKHNKRRASVSDAIKNAKSPKKKSKSIYSTAPLTNGGYDLSARRLFDYWEGLDKETVCLAWKTPEKFADWGIRNGFVNGRQLLRRDPQKLHNPINSYWK